MKFIKPSVEIITEPDLFKRIEIGARNCWRSDDRIGEGTAEKMFQNLVKRGHESPMEHSFIRVVFSTGNYDRDNRLSDEFESAIYSYSIDEQLPSYVLKEDYGCYYGNLRAWRTIVKYMLSKWDARDWNECTIALMRHLPGLDGLCLPEIVDPNEAADIIVEVNKIPDADEFWGEYQDTYIITARFICDRAVQNELVRHRLLGLSVESTRYVRYEDGLTLIEPWWWPEQETVDTQFVRMACQAAEDAYCSMLRSGCSPQKARCVLPLMLKTEVVATATAKYWKECVLPLRLSKAAHPDIRRLMELFCQQLGWDPDEFRK